MLDLSNHHQSIQVVIDKHSQKVKYVYRMRLEASIDVSRLLLQYGLPFRGHDESESSINQGFFLGLLRWHGDKHPDVGKVILENAPQNDTLTCPMIQKDIANACAKETLKAIIGDLNGDYFGILVDESKDISHKEQMALVLRFVNKNGEINGLKTLIMKDSPSAYYIHCFAHQLQLTLVAIAKKHLDVEDFFDHVSNVLNVVGGSFKRRDLLRDHQAKKLEQLFESGEVQKGQGLHQERGLQRPGDTHQDIVNAVEFLNITKKRLQDMRENGWESLLDDVSSFCDVHDILIPKLDESYFPGKSKRKSSGVSYAHHLCVEVFFVVIDVQLQELNDRFDVVSSDLLLGMGSLNPVNSFCNFDKGKIMTLAKCYPSEFDDGKIRDLSYQLDTFIIHMRSGNPKFSNLQGIRDLAKALVEANLAETYSLVYLLVKLTLILLLLTTRGESIFTMKHIKNEVRNSIGNQYLNDCLVCYIERDVFRNVSNDVIIYRFQNMKTRRGQL
ncbi:hypothetical protein R3W88_012861 [Solanum pinnatisectum]|uniref:DUF4371 domain-containing protein n=1 Tax=Solanum pinnatisectum TaxID=50273 RepID=A0AAV9LAV8_9SOLN|nr:hypothetical protein R3W88_012861 [Solanum pinnatisectum]